MLPLVSVITVVRNAATTITETIESVLSQDYPHLEYVIIDGGSTDGTPRIIEQYRDRVSVFVSEKDAGLYFGMQKGLQRSTGSMVLFLNADDVFVGSRSLSHLVDARVACGIAGPVICYSDFVRFYPKLGRSFVVTATGSLRQGMELCHQAMLADRSAYERVGGFDTSFRLSADFDWVARAKRHGVYFLKASGPPTAFYRLGGLSDSQYRASRAEAAKIIRREYGWGAFARYTLTQRWRFCLRAASESFEALFGCHVPNLLRIAYLQLFRGHRVLHPADR